MEQPSDDVFSPIGTSHRQRSRSLTVLNVDFNSGLCQQEIKKVPVITIGSIVKSGLSFLSPVDIRSPGQEDSDQLKVSFLTGLEEDIPYREVW